MRHTYRTCNKDDDFWRARNFLREVFLLNDRLCCGRSPDRATQVKFARTLKRGYWQKLGVDKVLNAQPSWINDATQEFGSFLLKPNL